MVKIIKVAAIQSKIYFNKQKTIEKIKEQIKEASKYEVDLVCLPERWNYLDGTVENDPEDLDGISNRALSSFAKEFNIHIIGGAIWQKHNDSLIITSSIFGTNGDRIGLQQKQHLYLFERKYFKPGGELKLFDTKLGKLGILICFDMTFPEAPRKLTLKGADILITPVMIRFDGIANWHIYLKARALENRIPVVGVNVVGEMLDRIYPGQSMIIDFKKGHTTPSKLDIVIGKKNEPDVVIKDIDLNYTRKLRKKRLEQRTEYDNYLL
ncbi:MAG: carbon-nitrogen hydrolase family protein [Candidatus Helarchaeota archaeon]